MFVPPPPASVRAKTLNNPGRSTRWYWSIAVLLVIGIGFAIWIRIVIARAQPILRGKIVETLSARFNSRVELGDLHVWIDDGLHVEGKELKIFGVTDPNPGEPGVQPLIDIGTFELDRKSVV